MQLSELFVSHKQVDPVEFDPVHHDFDNNIYLNLDRARTATSTESASTETPSEDTSSWSTEQKLDWKVGTKPLSTDTTNATSSTSTSAIPTGNSKRWENPYKNNRNKWVSEITSAYKALGLNDNAIKNLIAKNALESGWGNSAQGDFNFGNITTGSNWSGRFVQGKDHNAAGQPISQKFRAYDSLGDYVRDEIQFLTRLYDFNQNDSFDTFMNKLQGGNRGKRYYAEAPYYITNVRRVYNSI
jgi:flagellum-specific peptidoglycan hydrolase FlgJ